MSNPSATDAQIREAAMTRGSNEAARYLRMNGLACTESRVSVIISQMIAKGERKKIKRVPPSFNNRRDNVNVSRDDAEVGCRALLRAHLQAGKHWITDPARFADTCASVGLAA